MIPSISKHLRSKLIFSISILLILVATIELLGQSQAVRSDTDVTVVEFNPLGEIYPETNITIKFSNDMVSRDSLDKNIEQPPLIIKPVTPGVARWIETDMLRFYPDHPLRPATEYSVEIDRSQSYLNGNRINDKRKFNFRTEPFRVTNIDHVAMPEDDNPGFIRLNIFLEFNYPVDVTDLRKKLSIAGEETALIPKLSYEFDNYPTEQRYSVNDNVDWSGNNNRFTNFVRIISEPIKTTDTDQKYTMTIDDKLDCQNCGEPLKEKYERTITVYRFRRLVVNSIRGGVENKSGVIYLNLSSAVSTENIIDYLTISPEIDFKIDQRYRSLTIRGDFKSGENYEVTLSRGAPAQDGALLENEFSSIVTIPDIPPTLGFTTQGVYLPREGAGLLEVETINVDSLSVEIEKIFANNLVYALTGNYVNTNRYGQPSLTNVGRHIISQSMELNGTLNEPLLTTIDIAEFIGDSTRGIYKISARKKEQRWDYDARFVLLTDLGIMARMADNYLMVWVNNLSETKSVKGAVVKLFSRNNQILLEGKTDSKGVVIFENIAEQTKGFDPYMITVEKDDDLSYLRFDESQLPTSEFEIKGRPFISSGYEAFLYMDRDIFRPGDTAHLVAIVRDMHGDVPPEFPYFLIMNDPAGREFNSFRVGTGDDGLLELTVPIPDFARTGKYTAISRIGKDYEIGRYGFQVEEFMPDKIKTEVATTNEIYAAGDTIKIEVTGKYLFGPPAAGHKVSGHIMVEPYRFTLPGKSDYIFADADRTFSPIETNLSDQILNNDGQYEYSYQIPDNLTPPSALKGLISAGVSEQGGRMINNYKEVVIHPYDKYLGIRLNLEGYARPGEPFSADIIGVNKDGTKQSAKSIRAEFYRVVYHSILKKDSRGFYRYTSEKKQELIDSSTVQIPENGLKVSFTPPQYGSYKLLIRDMHGGHTTATTFYASGWGYSPWSMEKPDRIDIDFDRESYEPGDDALVQIRAPFGGTLLITIEKDGVLDYKTYQMDDNTAEITLPVRKAYFPNAYLSATVIKKAVDVDKVSPARAYGVAPIKLSRKEKDLAVDITAPEKARPGEKIKVGIQLEQKGISKVTISAVDAGILQLTDFATPNPLEFFYGQRQLYLKPYDIYSLVYPEIERATSHLSPAGGRSNMFESSRKRHLNPIKSNRVKPVSLWSGIVKTDDEGKVEVEFNLPQFNGQLIFTAVAVQDDKYSAGSADMIVKDKIVLQENFPRFVSPNDMVDGLVTLFNNTGANNNITVEVEADGPVKMISDKSQMIHLGDNKEGTVKFRFSPTIIPGVIHFKVKAFTDSDSATVSFELPNRPIQPLKTVYGSGVASKFVGGLIDLPSGWIEGTDQYNIRTSGLSSVGFIKNINYLLRYPYGCLEQTTSQLFPMLYVSGLARFIDSSLIGPNGSDYFIREGILKLTGMMRDDGYFAYWPNAERIHYWSSIYASHFLLEAQKAGYYLNEDVDKKIRRNLKQLALGKVNEASESERIYAAYVLAGAGQLNKKVVNYLRERDMNNLPPFSRYQAAGALARSGDKDLALSILPNEIQPAIFEPETGGTFSSGVRTNAILLEVLNEIDPNNPSCAALANDLMQSSRIGRWYTTQDNAFGLMALGKYLSDQPVSDLSGTVYIEGDSTYNIDNKDFQITKENLGGKAVQITVEGDGKCFYYWQASGVPTDNAPEEFIRGIEITREYLDPDGNPIDVGQIKLGDQIISHIKAQAIDKTLYNVVINDLLPAGLEIENPRLKTSPALSWLPRQNSDIEYQDIRDDRLLLFTNLNSQRPVEFYYSLRAIASGEFKLPPVSAECMYNPLIAGSSSSGFMVIGTETPEE